MFECGEDCGGPLTLWGGNGAEASRREKITGSGICSIGSSFLRPQRTVCSLKE